MAIQHDHTQSLEIAKNMAETEEEMKMIASDVGVAVSVERLNSRRMDKLLAKYVLQTHGLDSRGRPVPVSFRQMQAQTNPEYEKEFEQLATQLKDSCILIKQWEDLETRFKASQSIMSFAKRIKEGLNG